MLTPFLALLQDPIPSTDGTPPPEGSAGASSTMFQYLPLVAIFVIFYFVLIGPERKARKKREAMLAAMKKGDKVMTSGGMFGTIVAIQDKAVTLQLDEGVRVRFSRQAIQEVLAEEEAS